MCIFLLILASTGSIISMPPSNNGNTQNSNSVLSRPMQRKLITLVNCQLVEEEGRARALRAARSLGERTVTELILQHQNPQQLSSNLWAAVRGRGCQFLGPGWLLFMIYIFLIMPHLLIIMDRGPVVSSLDL